MTVAAVAERAHVSRATAYRYFNNNEGVLLAATVPPDQPRGLTAEDIPLPAENENVPVADLAAKLVRDTALWAFEHEAELRAVLALTLAPDSKQHGITRKGITHRASWVQDLLNALPASVPKSARERLAASLMPLFGADAVVWTTDVAELEHEQAVEVLCWMAQTLTTATIAEFADSATDSVATPRRTRKSKKSA